MPGMVDVHNKRCEAEDCQKHPTYGIANGRARFCTKHKGPDMVDVHCRPCEFLGCSKHPHYAFEGDKARFCASHKEPGMVDVKHKRCHKTGCREMRVYETPEKKSRFCAMHLEQWLTSKTIRRTANHEPGSESAPGRTSAKKRQKNSRGAKGGSKASGNGRRSSDRAVAAATATATAAAAAAHSQASAFQQPDLLDWSPGGEDDASSASRGGVKRKLSKAVGGEVRPGPSSRGARASGNGGGVSLLSADGGAGGGETAVDCVRRRGAQGSGGGGDAEEAVASGSGGGGGGHGASSPEGRGRAGGRGRRPAARGDNADENGAFFAAASDAAAAAFGGRGEIKPKLEPRMYDDRVGGGPEGGGGGGGGGDTLSHLGGATAAETFMGERSGVEQLQRVGDGGGGGGGRRRGRGDRLYEGGGSFRRGGDGGMPDGAAAGHGPPQGSGADVDMGVGASFLNLSPPSEKSTMHRGHRRLASFDPNTDCFSHFNYLVGGGSDGGGALAEASRRGLFFQPVGAAEGQGYTLPPRGGGSVSSLGSFGGSFGSFGGGGGRRHHRGMSSGSVDLNVLAPVLAELRASGGGCVMER
ncbi:EsV-1-7 [Ectocarpus siliculosus]|uniref:EsV-1-7 n=1 Tax=Ectocarpus siliculosus TaxID=2880 RepID=D8LQW3_ECTSI|nr:EsV-1-7 [Ectocarpus siliculosus]|eukprot:CBN77636.1 EsV-1-7 [Ectocarpus siliculosus]